MSVVKYVTFEQMTSQAGERQPVPGQTLTGDATLSSGLILNGRFDKVDHNKKL